MNLFSFLSLLIMIQNKPHVHVVAGILYDQQGQILLSNRPAGKAYAGYWEFAGGKVESGETQLAALKREFKEELDIHIQSATPWLTKCYDYEHAWVNLNFFYVESYEWHGTPKSREGQLWSWQNVENITVGPMLPANQSLLDALRIDRQFSGDLHTGLIGNHGYMILPYSIHHTHPNCMMRFEQWQHNTDKHTIKHTWIIIDTAEQFESLKNQHLLIWHITHHPQAQISLNHLKEGVSQPLIIATSTNLYFDFLPKWKSFGVQAVIMVK